LYCDAQKVDSNLLLLLLFRFLYYSYTTRVIVFHIVKIMVSTTRYNPLMFMNVENLFNFYIIFLHVEPSLGTVANMYVNVLLSYL